MKHASIPVAQLQAWAQLNGSTMQGVKISSSIISEDGIRKGGGLLSTTAHTSEDVLLSIPQDLILSKESVLQCAKTDRHLRQLVEAMEDFIQNPRKAIVLFLLYQMTLSDPDIVSYSIGVKSPFTDYFCSLPKEIPLPTFLSTEERELLIGTSLSDALEQKLSSLEKEFALLRDRTTSIDWCRKVWWDEDTGRLTFNDWLLSDALYRSRALELPRGVGDAMVPVLDMANHAADDRYNARFEIGGEGQVLLLVREGKQIRENEEVCITYGCGGASEMIFSYGFLEENVQSAREMFLTLRAPEDDPLRIAKMHFAKEAPGVRIFTDAQGRVNWESAFVWWACVNEEDGLDFDVLQTIDGNRELQALWQGQALDPDDLKSALMNDPRRDIFMLRATVMIQERVEKQGEELSLSQAASDETLSSPSENKEFVYETIRHLRELELDFLTSSYGALESEKQELLRSRIVAEYLAGNSSVRDSEGHQEEDFS